MNRGWAWAALAVLVIATLAWVAWPRGPESVEARTERIASELRCVECEGLSVADAATSTARATREEIRERVEAGDSDADIRQAYVDRYGEWALMNPTSGGVGIVVWALPVVVVAAGAAGIGLAIVRSRRGPRLRATPADEALVGAAAARAGAAGDRDGPSGPLEPDGDTLEGERDFLLRSVADLDAEFAAGSIDAETYATLHADYVARTAAVVRAIDGDAPPPEPAPAVPWTRPALVLGTVVVFATVAGVMLALALGARLPGGLPTGDDVAIGAEEREDRLRQAVADNPDDPTVHLALANFLVQREDFAEALPAYDTAADLDPADPVAPAQAGWLLFITASGAADPAQQAALLEGARQRLDAAVTIDADYPDARFYRGMVAWRGYGDAEAAVADFQRFLVLDPENPLADQVRVVLAEAIVASPLDANSPDIRAPGAEGPDGEGPGAEGPGADRPVGDG